MVEMAAAEEKEEEVEEEVEAGLEGIDFGEESLPVFPLELFIVWVFDGKEGKEGVEEVVEG